MDLYSWSWIFMVFYLGGMLLFGWIASRRIEGADDFATARQSYGPYMLALAFAASTASGATFLGGPGLSYEIGLASNWGNFLYPMGVYLGLLITMKLVASSGHEFGNRSIPEYLGDRYQSEGFRLLVSIFSLVLVFYITGQLVSGLVMFEVMLGLEPIWALGITTAVLLVYVVMGGAHADIMTDAVQGFMMLILAIVVIVLLALGYGVDGGIGGVFDRLSEQDENLVTPLNPTNALTHSWWSVAAVLLAHIPLGMLPHLGNKVWALKNDNDRARFIKLAFLVGLTLGMLSLGGLLARAILGDALLLDGQTSNAALPALFIEIFPAWLAALVGVAVLAAIMSTADGLVVAASQTIANDIYRRSIVPRLKKRLSAEAIDERILKISRWSTVGILILCMLMAWALMDTNITLLVLMGSGGMMAAFAGPLVLGALWRGVTRHGAFAGLISGMATFLILHTGALDPSWFGPLYPVVDWLDKEAPNPFSCAAIGEGVSVFVTWAVSLRTKPIDELHLDRMFVSKAAGSGEGAG